MDLNYRPSTYWPVSIKPDQLLSRIKGKARQDLARKVFDGEGFTGLTLFLSREELNYDERSDWGAAHPMLMGGEYLPNLEKGEVEIVRVSFSSTTYDQISIRAQQGKDVIRYRVVGEYENNVNIRYQTPFNKSEQPLTLKELVKLVDESEITGDIYTGGLVKANWEAVFSDNADVYEAINSVSISSDFYSDLEGYYDEIAKVWIEDHKVEDDEE